MPNRKAAKLYRANLVATSCVIAAALGAVIARYSLQASMSHTQEVDHYLDHFLLDVTDMNAGKQGYALTGRNEFLQQYYRGRDGIRADKRGLNVLTLNNAVQRQRLANLENEVETLTKLNDEAIASHSVIVSDETARRVAETESLAARCRSIILEALDDDQAELKNRSAEALVWECTSCLLIGILSISALVASGLALEQMRKALQLEHDTGEKKISQQREDFVAALAHDLKIPVVGAQRIYSLLLDGVVGDLTPDQASLIRSLDKSNKEQMDLITRLLQVYRYESDCHSLHLSEVDLVELIRECLSKYEKREDIPTIHFVHGSAKMLVQCDRVAVLMLVNNLVDNAIKHTPKAGAVNVTVSNKGNFATLEVQDTGSGFNEQYRDSMFDKFWQGPGSRKYAASVGLGLYLCKQVTDAHNGQITCLSAPNSGATFIVRLPIHSAKSSHLRLVSVSQQDKNLSATANGR